MDDWSISWFTSGWAVNPFEDVPLVVFWMILLLVTFLKGRENRHAWLILVPALVIHLALYLLRELYLFVPLEVMALFRQAFQSLTLGLAILWLIAGELRSWGKIGGLFIAGGILGLMGFFVILWNYGWNLTHQVVILIFIYSILIPALLIGLSLALLVCRIRNQPHQFAFWLVFWLVTISALVATGIVAVIFYIEQPAHEEWLRIFFSTFITGAILGGIMYLILIPFIILGLASPYFRSRLIKEFKLSSDDAIEGG